MIEIKQGTEIWHTARMGKVTASRVADLMATTKSGPAASRTNYMMELLCQRLTGNREEGYINAAMQRGTDLEPFARIAYEANENCDVTEVGFVLHPTIDNFGCSPDGLVGDCGLIEIKCPNTAQHVEFLRTGKPDGKYIKQMMAQMSCTERPWCDFVSYDDRMPDQLQYKRVRVERDDKFIAAMESEIITFLGELDRLVEEMLELEHRIKSMA